MNWTLFSWKSSLQKLNLRADVCFFGDSITRGGDFQNCFPSKTVCNFGISGDTLAGMLKRVDMISLVSPQYIFVMAGINDLLSGRAEKTCVEGYCRLLDTIRSQNPKATLYVQSVLPINPEKCQKRFDTKKIVQFNVALAALCKEKDITYIDVHALYEENGCLPSEQTKDGLHLYPHAYTPWMNKIRSYIDKG